MPRTTRSVVRLRQLAKKSIATKIAVLIIILDCPQCVRFNILRNSIWIIARVTFRPKIIELRSARKGRAGPRISRYSSYEPPTVD